MVMEVEYNLPPVRAVVDNKTKLPGLHTFKLRHFLHRIAKHAVDFHRSTHEIRIVHFWTNQKMNRCSRPVVPEDNHLVILIDDVSRFFAGNYSAEHTFHGLIQPPGTLCVNQKLSCAETELAVLMGNAIGQ
jgi:hypothetical protein